MTLTVPQPQQTPLSLPELCGRQSVGHLLASHEHLTTGGQLLRSASLFTPASERSPPQPDDQRQQHQQPIRSAAMLQNGPWSNNVNRPNDCGNVRLFLELGWRLCAHIMMIKTYHAQFTCLHVLCHINDCVMGPQSVCVNTPSGWRHSSFHSTRINQPSPVRSLSPPLSATVQTSCLLHQHFPWHGTSFPRSTIHTHVNVARHPSHSSRPPHAQAFAHVLAEVAFATCQPCRLSPVHPLWLQT